jgi:hypothetical protein
VPLAHRPAHRPGSSPSWPVVGVACAQGLVRCSRCCRVVSCRGSPCAVDAASLPPPRSLRPPPPPPQVAGRTGTVVDTSTDGSLVKVRFPHLFPLLWLPACCGETSHRPAAGTAGLVCVGPWLHRSPCQAVCSRRSPSCALIAGGPLVRVEGSGQCGISSVPGGHVDVSWMYLRSLCVRCWSIFFSRLPGCLVACCTAEAWACV